MALEINKKALFFNLTIILLFLINFNILLADQRPKLTNIWDIKLGMFYSDIPTQDFMFFACGTNGGPPSRILKNKFNDYNLCQPDENNLREVYFEYDDEAYYWALAFNDTFSSSFQGTRVFSHPSILSLLFDADGIVQGVRIVTDDRASHNERKSSAGFFFKLEKTFGDDPWDCVDFDPEEGETPIGASFLKRMCIKEKFDKTIILKGTYFRKKGQTTFNPVTNKPTTGYFESSVRLDVFSKDINVDYSKYGWNK